MIKFVLQFLLFLIKTKQLKNALTVVLYAIKYKLEWDQAVDKLTRDYFLKLTRTKVKDFKQDHAKEFKTVYHVDGYDKWLKDNPQ